MTHTDFTNKLDAAILRGESLAVIARGLGINQTTVRRRKSALRDAGHLIPAPSLRYERGINDASHNS